MLSRFKHTQVNKYKPPHSGTDLLFWCLFSLDARRCLALRSCHTSCHLPAVSWALQSFMSAWLVMRADRKRWDSPISPPTCTQRETDSHRRQSHWVHICVPACEESQVCVYVRCRLSHFSPTETTTNHTKLLLTLQLLFRRSSCVFISNLSPSRASYFLLSLSMSSHNPLNPPCPFLFFFSPSPQFLKFDTQPSVNSTKMHLDFLHLVQFVNLSRCCLLPWLQLRNISVLWVTAIAPARVCVCA